MDLEIKRNSSKKRKLKLETIAAIYANYKEPEYLVDGLIAEGTINIICGQPKVGKSLIALSLAKGLSSGGRFLKKFKCSQSNVLYIDEDNGSGTIHKRTKSLRFSEKNKYLKISISRGYKIDDESDLLELKNIIKEESIDVVIFDSFVRIHSKEENSSSEMREISSIFRKLTKSGLVVIIIHHSGKQSMQGGFNNYSRGSSEIEAGADNIFTVLGNKKGIKFKSTAMRDSDNNTEVAFSLVEDKQKHLKFVNQSTKSKREQKDNKLEKDLLKLFKKNKTVQLSFENIDSQIYGGKKKKREILKKLIESKEIKEKNGAHNASYYSISE